MHHQRIQQPKEEKVQLEKVLQVARRQQQSRLQLCLSDTFLEKSTLKTPKAAMPEEYAKYLLSTQQ